MFSIIYNVDLSVSLPLRSIQFNQNQKSCTKEFWVSLLETWTATSFVTRLLQGVLSTTVERKFISVNSNQLMHIFIKKHIKII
jgi:hypothetical protein